MEDSVPLAGRLSSAPLVTLTSQDSQREQRGAIAYVWLLQPAHSMVQAATTMHIPAERLAVPAVPAL